MQFAFYPLDVALTIRPRTALGWIVVWRVKLQGPDLLIEGFDLAGRLVQTNFGKNVLRQAWRDPQYLRPDEITQEGIDMASLEGCWLAAEKEKAKGLAVCLPPTIRAKVLAEERDAWSR